MDRFQNKYRIPSARLQGWDYSQNGTYFITICTAGREHYFGEIENGKMQLSHIGIIADILWHDIPHHSTNTELGAFVVMPNHIHGVLILNNPITDTDTNADADVDTVETLHATSLQSDVQSNKNEFMATISPKPNSVSAIIRSYKSAVSKHAHRLGFDFNWQTRFHDHIIRNDAEYQRIANYINANPENWETDKFYKTEEL
jgi:REP element-mobilizing transposase RayT